MSLHDALAVLKQLLADAERAERDGGEPVKVDDIDIQALKVVIHSVEHERSVQSWQRQNPSQS